MKMNVNIPILSEGFLTFANKSSVGQSFAANGLEDYETCTSWIWHWIAESEQEQDSPIPRLRPMLPIHIYPATQSGGLLGTSIIGGLEALQCFNSSYNMLKGQGA